MIYQQLQLAARESPRGICIVEGDRIWSNAELLERVEHLAKRLATCEGRTCGIATSAVANLLIAIGAVKAAGGVPVILPSSLDRFGHKGHSADLDLATTLCDDCVCGNAEIEFETPRSQERSPRQNSLILFTSGTSGPPKPIAHTWAALTSALKLDEAYRRRRWLLAYDSRTFAGLQVILQSVLTSGILVVAKHDPRGDAEQLIQHDIEFASATPTYWRAMLNSVSPATLRRTPLRQVTLGGEIADQLLLDRLRETFPQSRVTHIYASTELGVCFSVHDGRAGFPSAWLDSDQTACRIRRAADGEMEIKRAQAKSWFATGDLVEVATDRVLFTGRKSDIIHIGGRKVSPTSIEEVIRSVPNVLEVRVFGVASSLTGEVAAAEVQLSRESDELQVRDMILTACHEQLPKYMMPATIAFSTQPLTSGDKLRRHA